MTLYLAAQYLSNTSLECMLVLLLLHVNHVLM